MDLNTLQQQLRDFAIERSWQPFHTPKNLAMALMVESAELLEVFQWMTPEQSQSVKTDPVQKAKAADEVADVLLYLLQLADQLSIDIPQAVGQKLLKNAQKHPAPAPVDVADSAAEVNLAQARCASASLVSEVPETAAQPTAENADGVHVLIDWENVRPAWSEVQPMVPDCTHVWLLHGPHQKQMDAGYQALGERFTSVPSVQAGKNSLDFQLSFYCGYLASKKGKRLVVVANDLGYEPMIKHAKLLGFDAMRLGIKTEKPAGQKKLAESVVKDVLAEKPVVVQGQSLPETALVTKSALKAATQASVPMVSVNSAAKAAPANVVKITATKAESKPKALAEVPASLLKPSAAQYACQLLAIWRTNKNRPSKPAALLNAIKAITRSESIEAPMVKKVLSLLQSRGDVRVDEKAAQLTYKEPKRVA